MNDRRAPASTCATTPRRVTTIVVLVVLLTASAGCGGSSDQPSTSMSPLEAFFATNDATTTRRRTEEIERRRQTEIVACMHAQGFDYQPEDPLAHVTFPQPIGPDLSPEQFATRYGFGIVTEAKASPSDRQSLDSDPNRHYVSSLSVERQAEYRKALYGPSGSYDYTATTGCQAEARQSLILARMLLSPADEESLGRIYANTDALVDADPAVVAAEADYAACMRDAGYPSATTPEEAHNQVGIQVDRARSQGASLDDAFEFELEIAHADFECGQPLVRARAVARDAAETKALESNRSFLERVRKVERG